MLSFRTNKCVSYTGGYGTKLSGGQHGKMRHTNPALGKSETAFCTHVRERTSLTQCGRATDSIHRRIAIEFPAADSQLHHASVHRSFPKHFVSLHDPLFCSQVFFTLVTPSAFLSTSKNGLANFVTPTKLGVRLKFDIDVKILLLTSTF